MRINLKIYIVNKNKMNVEENERKGSFTRNAINTNDQLTI